MHTPTLLTRPSCFELLPAEQNAIDALVRARREEILETDRSVSGFNLGFNDGESAGQTVWHAHVHLIPRRPGDVADPRGGVRYVVPNKANYSG